MKKNKKQHKKGQNLDKSRDVIKIKSDLSIGSPDAETDNKLSEVFIDNGSLDALLNVDNPKCVIIGRTGAGKSALVK